MNGRAAAVLLIALLGVVQGQLWFGRGSVREVQQMQRKLDEQKAKNTASREANERLGAEVRDLREGLETVEEKARSELGMVKPNEVFVQIVK